MATVLVIEDCAESREILRGMLEGAGHRVIEADSRRSATAAIANDAIELIVTDILAPDLSELEVLRQVTHLRPNVPIVAISGGGAHISAVESLSIARLNGATQILYKPFRKKELLSAVKVALRSKPP